MKDTARRIAKVSLEAKLKMDEEEYVESFKPHMMDIVHAWCNGAAFSQLCKMTDIFEGMSEKLISKSNKSNCVYCKLKYVWKGLMFILCDECFRQHHSMYEEVGGNIKTDVSGSQGHRKHRTRK